MFRDSWYTRIGFIWWGGRWLATRYVPVDVSKAKRVSWVTSVWDSWSRQYAFGKRLDFDIFAVKQSWDG
jgi:hypothetical protein